MGIINTQCITLYTLRWSQIQGATAELLAMHNHQGGDLTSNNAAAGKKDRAKKTGLGRQLSNLGSVRTPEVIGTKLCNMRKDVAA